MGYSERRALPSRDFVGQPAWKIRGKLVAAVAVVAAAAAAAAAVVAAAAAVVAVAEQKWALQAVAVAAAEM
jgi:hypothetical protein